MCARSNTFEFDTDTEKEWYDAKRLGHGLRVADTLDEVKTFAFESFDRLDKNADGFISKAELVEAMNDDRWGWREKSYICFMLRRIDDIQEAYDEQWSCQKQEGISRADVQEYFKVIRTKISSV